MTTAPHRLSSPSIPRPFAREPREIHVDLEARETAWEIAPGRTVSAWGYQGSVPGPTIVAHVGDTLVAHLVNNLPGAHGASTGTACACPRRWTAPRWCSGSSQPGERFEYRFDAARRGHVLVPLARERDGADRARASTARSSCSAPTSRSSTRIACWCSTT